MKEQPEFNFGATALANAIKKMIRGVSEQPPAVDIGIINSDYSLTTNRFPCPIPKEEYSVCRSLLYEPSIPLTQSYVDGAHNHFGSVPTETHQHDIILPTKMHWVKPGQKVLVAIVQNEFIVVDIIYDGKWLGSSEPAW